MYLECESCKAGGADSPRQNGEGYCTPLPRKYRAGGASLPLPQPVGKAGHNTSCAFILRRNSSLAMNHIHVAAKQPHQDM